MPPARSAAAGIEIFLGQGPYTLSDGMPNPNATGVLLTNARFGLMQFNIGGETRYALHAEGTVKLVGLDGLDVTGFADDRLQQLWRRDPPTTSVSVRARRQSRCRLRVRTDDVATFVGDLSFKVGEHLLPRWTDHLHQEAERHRRGRGDRHRMVRLPG